MPCWCRKPHPPPLTPSGSAHHFPLITTFRSLPHTLPFTLTFSPPALSAHRLYPPRRSPHSLTPPLATAFTNPAAHNTRCHTPCRSLPLSAHHHFRSSFTHPAAHYHLPPTLIFGSSPSAARCHSSPPPPRAPDATPSDYCIPPHATHPHPLPF